MQVQNTIDLIDYIKVTDLRPCESRGEAADVGCLSFVIVLGSGGGFYSSFGHRRLDVTSRREWLWHPGDRRDTVVEHRLR